MRRTDDKLMASLDETGMIGINSVHCIQLKDGNEGNKLKCILAQLNSKLLNWVFRVENFHMVGKPLAEVKVVFVERLPYKNIEEGNQKLILNSVDAIVKMTSELQTIQSQFLAVLQSKFDFVSTRQHAALPSKLQGWYELEFKEFVKELEKATRQRAALSLRETAEWLPYFEEQKKKAVALKSEIEKTDREIDRMVYALYELTEEEVKIVEGNTPNALKGA